MRTKSRVKQAGVFFSFLVIFLITFVLPTHYHTELTPNTQSHCPICQLVAYSHITLSTQSATRPVIFNQSNLLVFIADAFSDSYSLATVAPRAPPFS